jgi:DNA excision repair protein ERCC-2
MDKKQLENLYFPYESIREVQSDLIIAIDECLKNKKSLIAHAPTGLGKTVSSLAPALKHAIEKNKTILFLTSRHTQHLIALETASLIKKKFNLDFKTADIIGKKWMCIQEGAETLLSNEFFEFCKNLREKGTCEFYVKTREKNKLTPYSEKFLSDLNYIEDHGSENIKQLCKDDKLCPYEIAIEIAKKAKLIICDYNYVFDPVVSKSLFSKIKKELEDCIIIIDEGHNLPERIRNIMTFKLSTIAIKRAIKESEKFKKNDLSNKLNNLMKILEKLSSFEERLISKDELINSISNYNDLIDDLDEAADEVREKQRQSYLGSIALFLENWKGNDEGYIRFISKRKYRNDDVIVLSYKCLDPSMYSSSIMQDAYCVILMSGTLTPTDMYKDILGFPSKTKELTLPSPFPNENKLCLVIPKTTTKFTKRSEEMFKEIAKYSSNIIKKVPGNIAIFFPSYDIMKKVYVHLYPLLDRTVFKENPDMLKKDRKELLEDFSSNNKEGGVLLGVASGSFGEGIDLPGDLLKAVMVIGLPLSKPDLETKELIKYYDNKMGKGWDYGYIFPAFSKTLQNAGRCIRSETDKGIIVFLDERFTWPNYFKNFPTDMEIKITIDYENKIEEFFGKS